LSILSIKNKTTSDRILHGFNGICRIFFYIQNVRLLVLFIIQISNLDEMWNFLKSFSCLYLCIFVWRIDMYCDFIFKLKCYSVTDLVFHCANKIHDFVPSHFIFSLWWILHFLKLDILVEFVCMDRFDSRTFYVKFIFYMA
jgi:hypothetical protein